MLAIWLRALYSLLGHRTESGPCVRHSVNRSHTQTHHTCRPIYDDNHKWVENRRPHMHVYCCIEQMWKKENSTHKLCGRMRYIRSSATIRYYTIYFFLATEIMYANLIIKSISLYFLLLLCSFVRKKNKTENVLGTSIVASVVPDS